MCKENVVKRLLLIRSFVLHRKCRRAHAPISSHLTEVEAAAKRKLKGQRTHRKAAHDYWASSSPAPSASGWSGGRSCALRRVSRGGTGTARKCLVLEMGLDRTSSTTSPTLNWLSGSCAWYFFLMRSRRWYFGCGASRTTSTPTVLFALVVTTRPVSCFAAEIRPIIPAIAVAMGAAFGVGRWRGARKGEVSSIFFF